MSAQVYCIMDYESRSLVDITECGAFEYSMHPTTSIMHAAWAVGTREELEAGAEIHSFNTLLHDEATNLKNYKRLYRAITTPGIKIGAHNALFEQLITKNVLGRALGHPIDLPPKCWFCTAALAASYSFPRKLEHTCPAMRLDYQKNMRGHRLMLKYTKPRKATKNNSEKWHADEQEILEIEEYCRDDVRAEIQIFLSLPPLIKSEQELWEFDQKINMRGFRVDRFSVKKSLKLIAIEAKNLQHEVAQITDGKISSTNQVGELLKIIKGEGLEIPNMQANTINEFLEKENVSPLARRLLEIRKASARTSTAKYFAMLARSKFDGRLRDILLYWAASTGRWAGVGLQPQNLPRGSIKDTPTAVELLKEEHFSLDEIKLFYGDAMKFFSSVIRSMIVASKGKTFFCGDYSSIELRGLFWLAEHKAGLNKLFNNAPMYEDLGSVIFNKPIEQCGDGTIERFVGKQATLGCGYGMGPPKFEKTCWDVGRTKISKEVAKLAVDTYRKVNKPVVQLWSNLEKAAITAVQNPGKRVKINRVVWHFDGRFLSCLLPSGRSLNYPYPTIRYEPTPWGEKRAKLYHWGWNQKIKKWVNESTYGGKLTENVVQAISRDIMAAAMKRVEAKGYEVVLTVHDELLTENFADKGDVKEFEELMATPPEWAKGFPIQVKGWEGKRYKK